MSTILIIEQVLNGLQSGIMLFLMAAGLTLIFGVMGLINLAHGSLYMIGAFAAAAVAGFTGSFVLVLIAAMVAAAIAGVLVCRVTAQLQGAGHAAATARVYSAWREARRCPVSWKSSSV